MLLDTIKKATTDYQAIVRVVDSTDGTPETTVAFNTAGVDLWYRREGAARVAITEVTQTVNGAHSDGGFVHVSDGYCRLDLPDAAVATGVDFVDIGGTFTDMVVIGGRIRLTDFDLDDAVRGGLTALPDAAADAAGGLPISDLGGADIDTLISNVADVLTDTGTTLDTKLNNIQGAGFVTGTDSLEAIRDRGDAAWTGGATTADSGTAQAGSSTTITLEAGFPTDDNILNGMIVFINSGTGSPQSKAISSYNGTTGVATIVGTWAVTPDATSVYEIYPADVDEISDPPTADAVADAVWNENTAGHTTAGTFGEQVKNDIDAILVDTSTTLDASIAALQGNITDILADTNELQADDFRTTIDAIETDTQDIQTQIGAAGDGLTGVPWNSAWDAEVESEVNEALVALNLDHLALTPVGSADVVNNTIIAKLVSSSATADWDDFVNTTDSLQAIGDRAGDIETDTQDIQSRLPAALIGGRMDSDVEAINNVGLTGDGSTTPFDVV